MKFSLDYDDYGIRKQQSFCILEINGAYEMFARVSNILQDYISAVENDVEITVRAIMYIRKKHKGTLDFICVTDEILLDNNKSSI